MCCPNDYRLSIYFLSECTQLRFVQLFNKAVLSLLLLLLLLLALLVGFYVTALTWCAFLSAVIVLIVPKEDRRRFMMKAWELDMTKGDYVFYTIEMLPEENVLNPEDVWASNDGNNLVAKEAFEAVFHVRHGFYKSYSQWFTCLWWLVGVCGHNNRYCILLKFHFRFMRYIWWQLRKKDSTYIFFTQAISELAKTSKS